MPIEFDFSNLPTAAKPKGLCILSAKLGVLLVFSLLLNNFPVKGFDSVEYDLNFVRPENETERSEDVQSEGVREQISKKDAVSAHCCI